MRSLRFALVAASLIAGFANAMRDLPRHTTKGGTLYVFGLD